MTEIKYNEADLNPSPAGPHFTDARFKPESEGLPGIVESEDIFDRFVGRFYTALKRYHNQLNSLWTARSVYIPAGSSVKICSENQYRHKAMIRYSTATVDSIVLSASNISANQSLVNIGGFMPAPSVYDTTHYFYQVEHESPGELWIINTSGTAITVYVKEDFYRAELPGE